MTIPILREVLCGMKLRTGALAVAYFSLACHLVAIGPLMVAPWGYAGEIVLAVSHNNAVDHYTVAVINLVLLVAFIVFMISTVCSALLLYGVSKNNQCAMIPWMVMCILSILLTMFAVLILLASLWVNSLHWFISYYASYNVLFGSFIQLGSTVYAFHIILSYYKLIHPRNLYQDEVKYMT